MSAPPKLQSLKSTASTASVQMKETPLSTGDAPAAAAPEDPLLEGLPDALKEKARTLDVAPLRTSVAAEIFRLRPRDFVFIVLGAIGAGGEGAMPIVFYQLFGNLVSVLAPTSGAAPNLITIQNEITTISIYMAIVAVAALVAGWLKTFMFEVSKSRITKNVRDAFFSSVIRQEIGFFDATKTGTLLSFMSEDISSISDGFGQEVGKVFQFFVQAIAGLILSFTTSWRMSLVILATAPVLVIVLGIQFKLTDKLTKQQTAASSQSVSTAEEVFTSMRTVRAFAQEDRETDKFRHSATTIQSVAIRKGLVSGLVYGFFVFAIWGAAALAFWYGGQLTTTPDGAGGFIMNVGGVVTVFGLMLMAILGLAQAGASLPPLFKAIAAGRIVFALIKRTPKIPNKGGDQLPVVRGEIEFESVQFKYPTRDEQVLKSVAFRIQPGQKAAFVGSSGSGKSTVFQLVQRFYEVQGGGAVKIDGVNIQRIDPMWLRGHLSIVSQEPILFADTILENIRYGRPTATAEEVFGAARMANAYDFIMGLQNKFDTLLGEKGVTLSGGQKQRIAIARAVLCNPEILLLDEATSSLDTESERVVQEALDRVMQGRTSLVIAHRLTTVMDSDVIFVMQKGDIVQMGKHADLLQDTNGLYYTLASRQLLGHGQADKLA